MRRTSLDQRGGGAVATLAVVGAVILSAAIAIGIYLAVAGTAGVRGRIALHNQVRSPQQQQLNYEKFHGDCRAVLALNSQIKTVSTSIDGMEAHPPANDPFGQYQQTIAQKQTDLDGLKNQRDQIAQGYNAASHEPLTRSFMKSRDLPAEIGPPNGVAYDELRCETEPAAGQQP